MTRPVQEKVQLPTLAKADAAITSWAGRLVATLSPLLSTLGARLNGSIHQDGTIPMTAPFQLATYTVATRPTATDYPGCIIYVSDGGAGAVFQGSDGTNWVNLG